MPRINLQLSEDLYARVVQEAKVGGIRHTDWVREAVAYRLGRIDAASDFEKRLAVSERELVEIRERLGRLERGADGGA